MKDRCECCVAVHVTNACLSATRRTGIHGSYMSERLVLRPYNLYKVGEEM